MPIKGLVSHNGECIDFADVRDYDGWGVSIKPLVTRMAEAELSRNGGGLHVSDLLKSPRQFWLLKRHDIYLPYESLVDRYIGTSLHNDLARADVGAHEMTLAEEVEGLLVEGTIDYIDYVSSTIVDYKTCKYYLPGWILKERKDKKTGELVKGLENWKPEIIEQLNIYRWLCACNNIEVKQMLVCFVCKDAGSKDSLCEIEVPIISNVETLVTNRIVSIQVAEYVDDEYLPDCPDEIRWDGDLCCKDYCDVRGFCDYAKSLTKPQSKVEKEVDF